MTANALSILFVLTLITNAAIKLWLASRQIRHVSANRAAVPAAFEDRVSLQSHQRAADYTFAKVRLQMAEYFASLVFLLGLTLLGGAQLLYELAAQWLPDSPWTAQLLFLMIIMALAGAVDLPFSWYRQFRLEKRFGFSRMTIGLWFSDLVKGVVLSAVIAIPLTGLVLWMMRSTGQWWWLAVWLVWTVFTLTLMVIYPTLIAPRFNKFKPMPEGSLRKRVETLLDRCGFQSRGLYVMDGSRRSSHGNAYFTGLGRAKRIVFFDTLLDRLNGDQIEAVLAHELGHFKHRHVTRRIVTTLLSSLAGLALLGWLAQKPWFYTGLGMHPGAIGFEAPALLLFMLVAPVFTFLLRPVMSALSRRDEFQADAFAASQSDATHLADALVRLYEDNASTLTPDPLHSAFYDSHPSASERISRLLSHHSPASA